MKCNLPIPNMNNITEFSFIVFLNVTQGTDVECWWPLSPTFSHSLNAELVPIIATSLPNQTQTMCVSHKTTSWGEPLFTLENSWRSCKLTLPNLRIFCSFSYYCSIPREISIQNKQKNAFLSMASIFVIRMSKHHEVCENKLFVLAKNQAVYIHSSLL